MTITEHHRKRLDILAKHHGLSGLKEIFYRVQRGDNYHAMKKQYSIELYELRYLQTCASFAHCYIHEQEQRGQLRLIYSNPMAA